MDEKELQKLYDAVSEHFEVGDFDYFKSKMQTLDDRKRFYDAVGNEGFDLGDYDTFESRLSGGVNRLEGKKKIDSGNNIEFSQSDILQLARERKTAQDRISAINDVNEGHVQFTRAPSAKIATDDEIRRIADINQRFKDAGYDESVADDLAGLPTGGTYAYDLKKVLPLKQSNPERYKGYLASIKFQGEIANNIEKEQGKQAAEEAVHFMGELQSNPNKPYYQQRGDTRSLVAMANGDQKIVRNIADARAVIYGKPTEDRINEFFSDPRYIGNEGSNGYLNNYQMTAMAFLEDVDPATANMYDRLLSVTPGKDLEGSKIGYDTKARELEHIGIGLIENATKQYLATDPDNEYLKSQLNRLQVEKVTMSSRYPAAAQMDAQRVMQEALGARNGVFKKYLLGVGDDARDVGNWIGDILTSPFKSDSEKALSDLELLGDKEFAQAAQMYQPENERLIGSDFVVRFSPDLQKQIDAIKAGNGDYEDKAAAVSRLIQKNPDGVSYVPNDKANKANFTAKAIFSNAGSVASQLTSQLALAYLMGGGGNVSKGRDLATLFGSTYATTYDDYYSQAIRDNIKNPSTYATIHSTIEASTELINNDFEMAKRVVGSKGALGAILDGTTKEVWDNAKRTGIWKAVLDAGLNTAKVTTVNALKETEEEVAGQITQNVVDQYAFDQDSAFTEGVSNTIITTMAAMLPLGIMGLPFKYREITRNRKYALYEMGSRPDSFLNDIDNDLKAGIITPQQAAERRDIIERAKRAMDNTVHFKMDGTPLTDNEKTDYAFNQFAAETVREQEAKAPVGMKKSFKDTLQEIENNKMKILTPNAVENETSDNSTNLDVTNYPDAASTENTGRTEGESEHLSGPVSSTEAAGEPTTAAEIPERLPQEELGGSNEIHSKEQAASSFIAGRTEAAGEKQQRPLSQEEFDTISALDHGLKADATQSQKKTHQDRIKPITNTIRSAAQKIRDFQLTDDSGEKIKGAFSDISSIPRHVLAKGLDIVADVLDAGATIADAMKSAIEYIKKAQPDADELQVRDAVGNYIENLFPKDAPQRRGLNTAIYAAMQTGKIKGEKVTMTPRQALHKQIRDIARGAATGFKAGAREEKERSGVMAEKIKALLKDAKDKEHISPRQWETLFKKANDIGANSKRFTKFADFVGNVLKDAEYSSKLDQAGGLRKSISTGVKSKAFEKSAYTNESVRKFARIDPSQVEDIDEYNEIAKKIVPVATGIQAVAKKGVTEIRNEAFLTDRKAIDDYVDKHEAYLREKAKQQLKENYSDLVAQRIIDPDTMSLQDMSELIDAIHGGDVDATMKAAEKFSTQQTKLEALRSAVDYNRLSLEQNPAYSEKENYIIAQLQNIDIDRLDAIQLAKLNDVINNIVHNNDFTGSQSMAILSEAQQSIVQAQDEVQKSGMKTLGSIRSALAQGFASVALQHEYIYKSTKLSAQIQHLSGTADIFDGHARAKLMQDDTIKAYEKMKGRMSRDVDSPINRIRRGIIADVMNNFGGSQQEVHAEFARRKTWIRQTGERLVQSGEKEESAEGELILQAYNELLNDARSADDVVSKASKDNLALVEFWRQQFEARREKTQQNAELLNNKVWEDVEGYTATKLKEPGGIAGMEPEAIKEVFANSYEQKELAQQVAGSKNIKTRGANLPEGRVLNLDFDNVQSRVFYRTNYDVETSEAIEKVRNFFSDKRADRLFGGVGNKKIVMNSITEAVNAQRGQLPPSTATDKIVNNLTNVIRLKGVRIALGSLSQVIKQYPSVALNTLVNLGADAYLFGKAFMVPNNIPLFKEFAIGLRGDTKAGFNKDVKLGEISAAKFNFSLATPLARMKNKTDQLTDLVMAALIKSDVSVARTSWLAYYMQDLKRQGVDINGIDWQKEHEKYNKEAAAYAEQQVSRTQNPNDVSSGSSFYRDARGTAGFFKNMVLPFSTFVVNARVRMTNDVQKVLYGGNKAEAYRSLAGTAAEMVTFNAIKTYIISTLTTMGARGMAALFGMWDDDDEKKAKNREQLTIKAGDSEVNVSAATKKMIANATSDFFFSGLGSLTQNAANQGMNALYKMAATEYFADGTMNKYPSLFYSRLDTDKTPDFSPYGLYGTLSAKLAAARNSARYAITGEYPGVNQSREDEDVILTDEERKLYTISFIVDALGIAGLSDADLLTLNQKLKWIADRKMADRHGERDKLMERNVVPK